MKFPSGVGQSLGVGELLVNPWNIKEVSTAIEKALKHYIQLKRKTKSIMQELKNNSGCPE